MHRFKTRTVAICAGLIALIVGLIVFTANWNVWGGGMPGYGFFLFPGNLTLIYVWHPLFTEELDFWPKLGLLLFGQFTVVTFFVAVITRLSKMSRSFFYTLLIASWACLIALPYIDNKSLSLFLFLILAIWAIALFTFRCSGCGVLLYRYNSPTHGIPNPKFLKPDKRCPACGSTRCDISFFQ